MRIWLPYVETGTGTDVFTRTLAGSLAERGHDTQLTPFSHGWQYAPWRLRLAQKPQHTQVVVANSWNAFAFKRPRTPLVSVEHLLVLDPALAPYRSLPQAVFHNTCVRYFERRSATAADTTVAVSEYTARQLEHNLGVSDAQVIYNGVDTGFFRAATCLEPNPTDRPTQLLFVGTLSRRKGVDLLPRIMQALGAGFELRFTGDIDGNSLVRPGPGLVAMGRLDREALRDAYVSADLLLFPTRLEGLGLVALEAMACGTPVIASDTGPLPEIVKDGVNGRLCAVDDISAFARAIRGLADDPIRMSEMGRAARETVEAKFSIDRMTAGYVDLFERLVADDDR